MKGKNTMKEGFDGSPIGVRITRRDREILKQLSTTIYPGLYLSMSDVARVLIREGMKNYGIEYPGNGNGDEPAAPVHAPSKPLSASGGRKK